MPLGESCALSIACTSLGGTMSFGLTADWDALPDIEVLARGIERSLRDLADARRDLVADDLGVPVRDLGQPAPGRLQLGRMTQAGEDAPSPGRVGCEHGFRERCGHEAIPPAVEHQDGTSDAVERTGRYVRSPPQSEHRSRRVQERVGGVRVALPLPHQVDVQPNDLLGKRSRDPP